MKFFDRFVRGDIFSPPSSESVTAQFLQTSNPEVFILFTTFSSFASVGNPKISEFVQKNFRKRQNFSVSESYKSGIDEKPPQNILFSSLIKQTLNLGRIFASLVVHSEIAIL